MNEEQLGRYVEGSAGPLWVWRVGVGRPVVLCDGGPGHTGYIEGLAAHIAGEGCAVYRFHQRGVGHSPAAASYTIADFIADLEAIRIHFDLDRWLVGGHSWGAALALAYCLAHRDRATGLLYISGTGVDPAWHDAYHRNRLTRLGPEGRQKFEDLRTERAQAQGADLDRVNRELANLLRPTEFARADRTAYLPDPDHRPSHVVNAAAATDWEDLIRRRDLFSEARQLDIPALVVHGEADPREARFAAQLADSLPGGRFAVIADAGHFPWIEQPHATYSVIRAFLDDLEEPGHDP